MLVHIRATEVGTKCEAGGTPSVRMLSWSGGIIVKWIGFTATCHYDAIVEQTHANPKKFKTVQTI